ncbi:hypothetical protein YC2023_111506 [Brassica napus]
MFYCVVVSGSWSLHKKVLWSFQSVKSSMALAFIGLSSFSKVVIFFKVLALRFRL